MAAAACLELLTFHTPLANQRALTPMQKGNTN